MPVHCLHVCALVCAVGVEDVRLLHGCGSSVAPVAEGGRFDWGGER